MLDMAATGNEVVTISQLKIAIENDQSDISDVARLDSKKMKSLHQLGITDLNNVTEPGTYVGASGLGGYPTISNLPDEFIETQSGGVPVFYIDVYRFDTPDDMGIGANYLIQKLYPMYENGVGNAYIRRGVIASGAQWDVWFGIGIPHVAGNSEVGYVLHVTDEYGHIGWGQASQPDMTGVVKWNSSSHRLSSDDGEIDAITLGLDSKVAITGSSVVVGSYEGSMVVGISVDESGIPNLLMGSIYGPKAVTSITDAIPDSPTGSAIVTDKAVADYVTSLVATDEEFDSVFGL